MLERWRRWLDDLAWDARYAFRTLVRRNLAFSVAAIVMLALAIGLNGIVFTVVDAMLFRGFPLVKESDRLIAIQEISPSGLRGVSYPDFEEWVANAPSLDGMTFVHSGRSVAFREGGGRSIDLNAYRVTANTFGLLGVPPMLGRDFVPADEVAGAAPVVILNYRFWTSRFGKRADIVGSTVSINGAPATVIGVMPERFDFPHQVNLWMPVARTPALQQRGPGGGGYLAFGRLRRGATVEQARAELDMINRRLQTAFPATNRDLQVSLIDNLHYRAGPNGPAIYGSLWVGACFVLLIACANVSNLTLVRTVGQRREYSTRMALGAGPWRLTRQILLESAALSSIAGVLGWWITKWGVRAWAVTTESQYQILDYRVDSTGLGYVAAISVAAVILFSLGPIVRIRRLRVSNALTRSGRGVTERWRSRLAAGLIAGQMTLAVVLLSGAGVLVRSVVNIVGAETGVRDPDRVLVGSLRLPSDTYPTAETWLTYLDRLDATLKTVPGIQQASVSSALPVQGSRLQPFEIDGTPAAASGEQHAQFISVGVDYFRVLGAPLIAGRSFTDADRVTTAKVAIVNQAFADTYLPGPEPIGNQLRVVIGSKPGERRSIVGVASNIMHGDSLRQQFKPVVYLPVTQEPLPRIHVLARTLLPPQGAARALRGDVERIDSELTLEDFGTLRARFAFDGDGMDLDHMELGKGAGAAPVFAVVALLLATIGLYAVTAHAVGQRTQEIGVRIAIGAAARDIRKLVLRDGMAPVVSGVIVGLAASFATNRVLQSQLVGVSPFDPVTIAGALAVLLVIALMACALPARRAVRVDPVVAIRHE
jgi:predicted permease